MTASERRLWALLRRRKLSGYRFRRQAPVGPFIADFFCPQARIIVELDGDTHSSDDDVLRDDARTLWLERHGCWVIRFWNRDVFQQPDEVVDAIYRFIVAHPPSGATRHLPPQGGKEGSHS